MKLDRQIKLEIESITKSSVKSIETVSGGCISEAYKLAMNSGEIFFLKLNRNNPKDMFKKEAHGLGELYKTNTIKVPRVIHFDETFILIEFIIQGNKSNNF